MRGSTVSPLVRDGVALAFEDVGRGDPPLVFIHGIACHRGFWPDQVRDFARDHRVLAIDLRGHGESDAPTQRYTMQSLADDIDWMCRQLGVERPVLVGHSLGGLVALELAASSRKSVGAIVLVDSVLVPGGDRAERVDRLVAELRGPDYEATLREYFSLFFAPETSPALRAWILDQAVRTPAHVTSSIWEEALHSWDDAEALARCRAPVLYLDAGTDNADLARAAQLGPDMLVKRTTGSGHFSQLEVPDQVNASLERFVAAVEPPTAAEA